MFYSSKINTLIPKHKICLQNCKDLVIKRQFSYKNNNRLTELTIVPSGIVTSFNYAQPVMSKKSFDVYRSFSYSCVALSPNQSRNQNKEKRANYIFSGILLLFCVLAFFTSTVLPPNYDIVHIEKEEKAK